MIIMDEKTQRDKKEYGIVQNIYFHFHLFTVQCMSSVYHAVKQNCASHHSFRPPLPADA